MSALSLLSLSPEILLCIAEALCVHCSQGGIEASIPSTPTWTGQEGQACLTALSRLSETCKTLRDIVQPILYHYPYPAVRLAPLVRTLIERPDLGQSVKELQLFTYGSSVGYDEVVSEKDQFFFEQEWAKQVPTLRGQPAAITCRWKRDLDHSRRPDENDEYDRTNFLALLILPHTPKVEKLLACLPYYGKFVDYPHGMLPHLTTLQVQHSDTGMGCRLGVVAGIMEAAPNLKAIDAQMVSAVDIKRRYMYNDNLSVATFIQAVVTGEDFFNITRGFPKLEILRYHGGTSNFFISIPATPAEMSQALLLCRHTLKEIQINMSESRNLFFFDGIDDGDVMKTLAGMRVLEKIVLDSFCIHAENDEDASTDLVNFLPKSVRVFGLIKPHEHLNQEILRLAASAREEFPALEKVIFKDLNDEQLEIFGPAFEQGGIEFVLDDRLDAVEVRMPPNW